MKIISRPIAGGSLVRDYLAGQEPAVSFFRCSSPHRISSYRTKLQEVEDRFPEGGRMLLAGELKGGGVEREARLARFVEEKGFAITTGQQPGLLGGPLFALYKALSAAALARRLEEEFGRPLLPIFWVASQDHDWEEIRRTRLPDLANDLATVELQLPDGMPPHSFHTPELGAELAEARDELLTLLPDSDFAGEYRTLLESSHGQGGTLARAEARLLEGLLHGAGVFILSPEAPALARAALPTLLAEAREASARGEAVRKRCGELTRAGYELQVPLLEDGLNLFLQTDAGRERLFRREGSGFRTRRSGRTFELADLETIGSETPERLTPNVLLRPVVESALVPTLAYVAGPGESAYFPQTVPLFEAAGRTPPVVHPRLSAFLLESKVEKVLQKFDLGIDELKQPYHELVSAVARDEIPEGVRGALGSFRGQIARGSKELTEAVREVDPTLTGSVDGVKRQGFALLDDLEKKVTQALKRENEIALSQLEKAQLHLFPAGTPQERVISPLYYLFRYGPDLLDRWAQAAEEAIRLDAPSSDRLPAEAGGRGWDGGDA